ncbi:MAG: RCC1 domain-containing protein [Caldilineaceae bacterium]
MRVRCWGANNDGQLGDGSGINQVQPVAVAGLLGAVTTVAAGVSHSCVLTAVNGVVCWGAMKMASWATARPRTVSPRLP